MHCSTLQGESPINRRRRRKKSVPLSNALSRPRRRWFLLQLDLRSLVPFGGSCSDRGPLAFVRRPPLRSDLVVRLFGGIQIQNPRSPRVVSPKIDQRKASASRRKKDRKKGGRKEGRSNNNNEIRKTCVCVCAQRVRRYRSLAVR